MALAINGCVGKQEVIQSPVLQLLAKALEKRLNEEKIFLTEGLTYQEETPITLCQGEVGLYDITESTIVLEQYGYKFGQIHLVAEYSPVSDTLLIRKNYLHKDFRTVLRIQGYLSLAGAKSELIY